MSVLFSKKPASFESGRVDVARIVPVVSWTSAGKTSGVYPAWQLNDFKLVKINSKSGFTHFFIKAPKEGQLFIDLDLETTRHRLIPSRL